MWTNHQTSQEHTNIMVASFATSSIHIFLCLVGPSFWKLYFLSISFVSNVSLRLFLFHRSLFVSLCESDPGWEVFRMSSRLSLLPLSLSVSLALSLGRAQCHGDYGYNRAQAALCRASLSMRGALLWTGHTHTHPTAVLHTHTYLNNHTQNTQTQYFTNYIYLYINKR